MSDEDKLVFSAEQDKNGNGIIDDDELTEAQVEAMKKNKMGQKDLLKVFYSVYIFTFVVLLVKFAGFFLFDIMVNIDISKLALALNLFIVVIGISEGVRSFTTTGLSESNERIPVPAYKLKILFGYLIAFAILTLTAVLLEVLTKLIIEDPSQEIPVFNQNDFLDGLVSNTVAYLVARFGDKIAEHIDLSSFKLFKK